MIEVSFNGVDMSGKSTLMKRVKESLEIEDFKVGISPHLMKFTDMSLKERLDMYETWTPEEFTNQAFVEVCKRSEDVQRRLSSYDFVLNDRGVLTQVGFCIGKYMTENRLPLEESFQIIDEMSKKLPFEDMSVIMDVSLERALIRAEGKEIWGEHYQTLIRNTREAIKYIGPLDYSADILNINGFKNLDNLCNSTRKRILNYKS